MDLLQLYVDASRSYIWYFISCYLILSELKNSFDFVSNFVTRVFVEESLNLANELQLKCHLLTLEKQGERWNSVFKTHWLCV
jgi:hypothetical protein